MDAIGRMSTTDSATVNSRDWWESYFNQQWDAHGGRAQTAYFMEQLVAHLPGPEREYLAASNASVLDWGCAFGNGVHVLAKAFPRCKLAGLDFSTRAIAEAKMCFPQYDFFHTDDGKIRNHFDVIVVSNCLEHFSDPLRVMKSHLEKCDKLYLALVPYREWPLDDVHCAQFREECFPEQLDGFTRLSTVVFPCQPPHWNGQQLLVAYGSPSYLLERGQYGHRSEEQAKWDHVYSSMPMLHIDEPMQAFGSQLADRIHELLPNGGRVLEAGCGAGWQSLMLRRAGRLDVTLMDFSEEALKYAQQSFAQENLDANFLCQDVFVPGAPDFDLVFNAGVLEHYSFDEQVAFLRGMASRSRKYVLALVPNRMCYWYWLWRTHQSAHSQWPYGKETPIADLSAAFEAAGLNFLGQWFGGSQWTDLFINSLRGVADELREEILAVHRSAIVPEHQRAYLVAALGCKEVVSAVPSCWLPVNVSDDFSLDQMTAAMTDMTALAIAANRREAELRLQLEAIPIQQQRAEEMQQEIESLRETVTRLQMDKQHQARVIAERDSKLALMWTVAEQRGEQLETMKLSRAWKLANQLQELRRRVVPPNSRREALARVPLRVAQQLRTPRTTAKRVARNAFRRLPLNLQYRIRATVAAIRRRVWHPVGWAANAQRTNEVPGLVSVVLPVYNHAAMLPGAVRSVLAQTYRNFELIIVNDGSTDGVERVLAEFLDDPRVRILTQSNQKLPKALSNGFEFARGEFWTWTSADNLMGPDQLRRQVEFLQSNSDIGMVYADYTAIDSDGRPLTDPTFRPQNRRSPHDPAIHLPHDMRLFGEHADNFIGPCFMYRGVIGRMLGEYDPILGIEDFDYWLRLSLVAPIAHLGTDETLYQYRVHLNSLSGRAEELQIPEHARRLMQYHEQRKAFHAKPWTIYADPATIAVLKDVDPAPHQIVEWAGQQIAQDDQEKRLLLLEAASLSTASDSLRQSDAPIVAWFPAGTAAVDRYRAESQRAADLCFADDEAAAVRLSLLTSQVFRAAPGKTMLQMATTWANGRLFYEATRAETLRTRALPRVLPPNDRPLRVLLQADSFTQGGMERVVIDLAQSLRSEGFEVSLLILGEQGSDAAKMRQIGVPILQLPEADRERHYRQLLKDKQIDVVNAHYSLFGARIAQEAGIPFVQTVHNTYIFLPPDGVLAYQANDQYTSAYICVSQMAAHYSDVKLGLPVEKMILVPNGVDVAGIDAVRQGARAAVRAELGLADEDFLFLNVGSLHAIKCQATLVNAFSQVVRECPEAKLVFAGRGMDAAYTEQVKAAISSHALEESVILAGHREDVARFYWAADAFILPSLCEGWSLALAEALAAGLPIIATRVGSAPDILPRIGGRLIRPPFGDITNLDYVSLAYHSTNEDPQFVRDITAAMQDVCRQRSRPMISPALRRSLDCREAYKPYGQIFLWLTQGGHPITARAWSAGRFSNLRETPSAKSAAA